ncbi:tyrosine-type recombinase/integrase, partial [Escherichia coli]
RAYCLKTQPATGETYPKSDLFNKAHIISTSGGNAGLSLEIHPHMLRHSCGFALANMGIDTRLIQDYLGHRNIRHTVWYTASNAGRFYGIWDRARGRQRHAVL